jgi:hypothetical protein
MNTQNYSSEKFVRGQHRASRLAPVLGVIAFGLAVTLALLWLCHPSFQPVGDWWRLRAVWLAGLAVTLAGAAVIWRARRRSLLGTAAEADSAFSTLNRLETATALKTAQDAMARAQRAETEDFLRQARLPLRRGWLTTFGVLAVLLASAHLATLICWARLAHTDLSAKAPPPKTVEQKHSPTPPAIPSASIDWISPESESSATAIEEVPLEAQAESDTGLRDAVLELEVNGTHRLSQPLPDDLTKAGRHALKLSIYLDQLEVKTYDMVSYHLSARRIFADKLPPTSSPVQFVQVKPMREDTFVCAGGDQPSKCFNYVTALKAAQLRLMKDNFTLAHAGVGHDNDDWRDANSRVSSEQTELAGRTGDVINLMATNHYPDQILGLVRESQPLMADAGAKIGRQENEPALPPQGEALGHLTEVEKYLLNSIKLASASTQPKANDPFQRPKNLELKTHPLTRAGKIDALAGEQSKLAGDLASGNTNSTVRLADPNASADAAPINGAPGERQAEIKQRINDFLNDTSMAPEALAHLQSSDGLAGQSLEQIDKSDFAAASEPAAAAARELHQTAEALRAGGDQAARNQLADALLKLSAAAGDVRRAAQAPTDAEAAAELKKAEAAVHEAEAQLAAEARRQQENGVTNAAARLEEMANLLHSESLSQMLAQAQQSPRDAAQSAALAAKLDQLAEHAARQRNPGPLSRQEVAAALEQLQRTQANLNRLASQGQNTGQNPGQTPGRNPGQNPGQSPSSAQSSKSGQSPRPSPGSQPPSPGNQSPGDAASLARGGQAEHARSPELNRSELQRAEAAQLLDDLRLTGADLRMATVDTVQLNSLDDILRQAANRQPDDPRALMPLVMELDPPLTGLIHSLQTELAGMRRPFELAAKDTTQAPPAYRAAVADYFEQLSRDYQTATAGVQTTNDSH